MPARFDKASLVRRVRIHDLRDSGHTPTEISEMVGLSVREVNRAGHRVKPIVNTPKIAWWDDQAACKGEDIEMFFPENNGIRAARRKQEAMRVCASCPVKRLCHDTALANYEQHGVWGGVDFSRYSYCFNEQTGRVDVRVKESGGEIKKVS